MTIPLGSTIVVLAKRPTPGSVKTRLCPPCTPEQAAEIAGAALRDTFAAVSRCRGTRNVSVFDGDPAGFVPATFETFAQVAGGLDARLSAAFDDVCKDRSPVVLIAMDTPQVLPEQLEFALHLLGAAPPPHEPKRAVIGMATDGGYWLIGLHSPDDRVFAGVPMSTAHTGASQKQRLLSLGYEVTTIGSLRDIDTASDLDVITTEHPHLEVSQTWRSIRQERGCP